MHTSAPSPSNRDQDGREQPGFEKPGFEELGREQPGRSGHDADTDRSPADLARDGIDPSINDEQREWFDTLVVEAVAELPPVVSAVLESTPLIVLDRPTPIMLRDLGFRVDADGMPSEPEPDPGVFNSAFGAVGGPRGGQAGEGTEGPMSDPGTGDDILDELCGLHTGTAITERSLEVPGVSLDSIHVFRRGLAAMAGGWRTLERDPRAVDELYDQVVVTLLHEIGHQMGLSEEDLEKLGYA